MPETPSQLPPAEAATNSYVTLRHPVFDNRSLAAGAASTLYQDLRAQILQPAPDAPQELRGIALTPEGLQPGEYERLGQVVNLVFNQLDRGYGAIRANRQNDRFSLRSSTMSGKVEIDRFRGEFLPTAQTQVLDLLAPVPEGSATAVGQWNISEAARRRLSQAMDFTESVLIKAGRAGHVNHPILGELHGYPGTIARTLRLPIVDRVRLGLQTTGDPRYWGLHEVTPAEYTPKDIIKQTGAPASGQEKGRLNDGGDTPKPPMQIPRPPKP